MIPSPSTVGLFLARRVEFEPNTKAVTVVDGFWRMDLATIPGPAQPFVAFAALRGSFGSGTIQVAAYRLDTHGLVYATQRPITFPDRLQTVYAPIRIDHFRVPVPGEYEFDLLVDGDIIAQNERAFLDRRNVLMTPPIRPSLEPIILDFNDTDYPPLPITPIPMEERFRNRPTQSLLDYLEMGVLVPEAEAAVRAELARRGVPPPTA